MKGGECMIKLAALGVFAFVTSVFAVSVAGAQTATPTATPTPTSSVTATPTPTGSVQGSQTTVPSGAPATGHGGF